MVREFEDGGDTVGRWSSEAARGDNMSKNLEFWEIDNCFGRFQYEMVKDYTAVCLAVGSKERHEVFGESVNIVLIFSDFFRSVDENVLDDPGKECGTTFATLRNDDPLQ